ncbi:Uncharacterized protein conserved in bacteria [Moraxella lacunata]|uniref:Uncharacterized protein conserved in bacteria n=1 Tax=Moraxella lacunata TaxID=477 RepID=A0A378QJS6_MORLA|nr:Uncharacterized protein conserved in bacteria [Moraxella lacunata]
MVITTHGRQEAVGGMKDVGEVEMLIGSAKNQQASYMQAMIDYMAEDRDLLETATPALSDDYDTIKASQENEDDEDEADDTGELSLPHILLASASSLIGVAKKNIHQYATEHITLSSGADLNIATGKKLLASVAKGIGILAHDMGIKMIAASGEINISAQRDDINIVADEVLRLISKRKKIELAAMEEIILNVQGNYIKILPDKIEQGTKGEWIVHANKHELSSPNTIEFELPQDPYDEMYVITDSNGNPVSGFAYKITTDDGRVYRGITNEKGETIRVGTANKAVGLTIEEDEEE